MMYDKFPTVFKLEERTFTSTFLFTYFWLAYLLMKLFQIERKIHN